MFSVIKAADYLCSATTRSKLRGSVRNTSRWISRDSAEVSGRGQTVNVSSSGILLTVEHVLSVGWRMEVRVDWPVRLHDRIPLKLVLQGQVVRSATREVALSINRYEFRTAALSGIDSKTG